MQGDDMQKPGMYNQGHGMRRPMYGDNKQNYGQNYGQNQNYSPSMNYNYNPGMGGHQMHPRRRSDRFKREVLGAAERIIRQNHLIINLLKDISFKLGASPQQPAEPVDFKNVASAAYEDPGEEQAQAGGDGQQQYDLADGDEKDDDLLDDGPEDERI